MSFMFYHKPQINYQLVPATNKAVAILRFKIATDSNHHTGFACISIVQAGKIEFSEVVSFGLMNGTCCLHDMLQRECWYTPVTYSRQY